MQIDNETFLKTLFGDDYIWAHVTAFPDDPSNITAENRMKCWSGDYFSRYYIQPNTNQYFTISTFYGDEQNKARRRKALFRCTHVIVADDVREKLDINAVERLPQPTYKLQTSPGSEQWGWVLDVPCTNRHMVENLLDGLVAQGLAPAGKDPGMKGVTRYVRLPEGVNSKASKLVNGTPTKCIMLDWNPNVTTSIESLAGPFRVDLHAERREGRVDGASEVSDHPLLSVPEIIVKEVRSAGRYDIQCPWVEEHTNAVDDGAAVFTNNDGSIGFKCHHGACEHRTGADLLRFIESSHPGFKTDLTKWQVIRSFGGTVDPKPVPAVSLDFMGVAEPATEQMVNYQEVVDVLRRIPPLDPNATLAAYNVLKAVDSLDHGTRLNWWQQVRDHMDWSKQDLQSIIEQQRKVWYPKVDKDCNFYDDHIYVSEQNQFYNITKRMWLSAEGFQSTFAHLDQDARSEALVSGRVEKVDRLDYAPGMPRIYTEMGVKYVNGWAGDIEQGVPGCVQRWLDHFDVLGWQEHKDHILKWMAFTLRHPEQKINHILLLGGGEGNGKDFLLYPLTRAMGRDTTTINGDNLLESFQEYLLSTKYLHINETELGDRSEAKAVTNKLKPLATAPPHLLRVNLKGLKPVLVRNVVNVTMTSNSAMPLNLSNDARRYYAVWTTVTIRDAVTGQVTKEWQAYWDDRWNWIRDCEGWKACVHYLMTAVDLSDFDPGRVPHLTEFVKEIQESSKDSLLMMIEEFILQEMGLLKSDLVTVSDIHASLKTAPLTNIGITLKTLPGANVIGKVMKQNGLGLQVKATKGRTDVRMYILRNHSMYVKMGRVELYKEYERQMSLVRSGTSMTVIEGGKA